MENPSMIKQNFIV